MKVKERMYKNERTRENFNYRSAGNHAADHVCIEGLTMYLTEEDVLKIFDIIDKKFKRATVLVEIMNPFVVKNIKEKSIDKSQAKFTWGVKNGKILADKLPSFIHIADHSLAEGMAVFVPIYRVLKNIPIVANISNKIVILRKKTL